jgi:hypothetical protein
MFDRPIGKHGMQHGCELLAVVIAKEAQKIDASQLLTELLADFGAGQPEAETEQSGAFGNEGLRQQSRDPRRLDLEPARRNAAIAYAIPIRVKLPARWLLHNPPDAKRYTVVLRTPILRPWEGKHPSLAQRLSLRCSWAD